MNNESRTNVHKPLVQIFLRVDGGSKVLREGVWEEKPGKSANRPPSLPLHHSRASRDCSRELRQNPRSSIAWAVQAFGIIRYSFVKLCIDVGIS